jgi:hypothetical protein
LVYGKIKDFFKLILYPATLLKLFLVSRTFLVDFFRSLRYKVMSSTNRDCLTFVFSICSLFISSSCINPLARIYKTMLNKSGESQRLVLFLSLEEIVLIFPTSYDVVYRLVLYSFYYVEVHSFNS